MFSSMAAFSFRLNVSQSVDINLVFLHFIYFYTYFGYFIVYLIYKGNNKITELRTILQRESQNS